MIVKVTREHIKKGKRKSSCGCMLARALQDGGLKGAAVISSEGDEPDAEFDFVYGEGWLPLPRKARLAEQRFEQGKPVKPFSFRIRDPRE